MNLLLVTAYCESDAERCVRLYNWIGQLGGVKNRVLFVTDRTTKHTTIQAVCAAAKPVCAGYETILIDPCPLGPKWPKGANWAFMQASKKVHTTYKCPFLWLEPDCAPTKKGWSEALESAYAEAVAAGKSYMGSMMTNKPPLPVRGMWGIAVYHPDVYGVFMAKSAKRINIAFDVTMADTLVPMAHDTKLIQCINGPGRVPQRIKPEHIQPETVLIHQDKFGDVESILGASVQAIDVNPVSNVTVVITNYKRPEHLRACFKSCMEAKVANLVVSSSAADASVQSVHKEILERHPSTIISSIPNDLGCNETWLRGVRLAKTEKVTILHDDDWLKPEYEEVVAGKFNGADIVHWDGAKHLDLAPFKGAYVAFPSMDDGVYPASYLFPFLLVPNSHTISPVGGLFPRQHIIDVLTECQDKFTDKGHFTRPSMMVGNDLMLWLRACERFKTVAFTHTPRISYGHWSGSESFVDAGRGALKLPPCYNRARAYWLDNSRSIIHTLARYPLMDEGSQGRFELASRSWDYSYSRGLVRPEFMWRSKRTSFDIGDKLGTQFLKDVLSHAMSRSTRDDDMICLTNDDTITNQYWWYSAYTALLSMQAVCSFRRDLAPKQWQPFDFPPKEDVGSICAGRDAFMFRKAWLKEHWDEIPDYLLGFGDWDSTLAMLMRLTAGDKPTQAEMTQERPSSELPSKFIHHVAHEARWVKEGLQAKGMAHNRELTNAFFARRLGWEMPHLRGDW